MLMSQNPGANYLLATLPQQEWARWRPRLEPVTLTQGQAIEENDRVHGHVYFPTTAIVSKMYITECGGSSELATIGREGMVGISLFMGQVGGTTSSQNIVSTTGSAFRLPAHVLLDEFMKSGVVLHLMLRYTQSLITEVAQMAACNRHHNLEQHLCRWLLSRLDRLETNRVVATHESIANMMGVRREGVTLAALNLQRVGLVSCSRGLVIVNDRLGLERRSCECYKVVKSEIQRLLWPLNMAQQAQADARHGAPQEQSAFRALPERQGLAHSAA